MEEIRRQYEVLLDMGTLLELFPRMKGTWEEDKDRFTKEYKEYNDLLGSIE